MFFLQTMQANLDEGLELMPNRDSSHPSQPTMQQNTTPIRKNSRNRGRESRRVNGSDDEGDEADSEDDGRRQSKRTCTLADQLQ